MNSVFPGFMVMLPAVTMKWLSQLIDAAPFGDPVELHTGWSPPEDVRASVIVPLLTQLETLFEPSLVIFVRSWASYQSSRSVPRLAGVQVLAAPPPRPAPTVISCASASFGSRS